MPRIGHTYRLHKASGQAFVALGGKRHYLGKYGTEESKNAYRLALLEYQTTGKVTLGTRPTEAAALTINEMLIPFVQHIDGYYVHPDGRPFGS